MDYDNNTMAAIYRCIILAAAGDGKVSDDELNFASEATHGTEQFYEFTNGMKGAFAQVMEDMFGLDDDDVEEDAEEEDEIDVSALESNEIKEIADEVIKNLAKCESASDIKAYTSICASVVPEDFHAHIVSTAFSLCGTDNDELLPDKKEIRNIKYLCSEFGLNFKETQKNYLDSLTWYQDDLLGDDLSVEKIGEKTFSGTDNNSADAVVTISILAAYADGDFSTSYQTIGEHWFLASCDIARAKGEKVVKVPDNMGDYLIDLTNSAQEPLHAKTGNPYPLMENYDENIDKITEIARKVPEHINGAIEDACQKINDSALNRLTIKNAYFMCDYDNDDGPIAYSTMNMYGEMERMRINNHEEAAINKIGQVLNIDEDALYGIIKRLESGEMGGLNYN